jgi:hypothetical protein
MVAPPLARVAVPYDTPPLLSVVEMLRATEPVGMGLPVPPDTVITADSACAVVMVLGTLTEILGVARTVSFWAAVFETWIKSPEYRAERVCTPTGEKPALKVVDPFDRVFGPPMMVEPS